MFDTLPDTGEDKDKTALTSYFSPKKYTDFEIFKFRQTKQQAKKSIDEYHVRLRKLAATCEFTDIDKEIKIQILQGCSSTRQQRQVLRDPEMTLTKLLDMCK